MGDSRQPHLNGAYYGPSIPPPSKTYHRPGRGGSSCNPFSCLMNCICTCVFQIICAILVVAAIVIVVIWLVFRPNTPRFYATNATLTEFNLNNNTLNYNLALNFTIRNPNRRIGVYYDRIEATAFYQGQRFATAQLQPFFQGTKSTDYVSTELRGQNLVLLGNRELSNYNSERGVGVYDVDVRLYLRIRMRFGGVRAMRLRPRVNCNDLRIPLSSNGTAASGVYDSRRCRFHWRR